MNVVFFGSPEPAVTTLASIVEANHDVPLVVTTPPHRRKPTPVEAKAHELGLRVTYDPLEVTKVGADLGVLMAYGRLLKRPIVESMEIVNIHPSLLPKWRGASPVEASILAGERATGVSLMRLTMGMDEGPLYAQADLQIHEYESADSLILRLVARGNELLRELLASPTRTALPQQGEASYCGKLTTEEFRINVSRTAEEQFRWLRVAPLWCVLEGKRLRIRTAQLVPASTMQDQHRPEPGALVGDELYFAEGSLRLETVQSEGRSVQPFAAWRNGIQQKGTLHVHE